MIKIAHLSSVHQPFDVRIFYKECCSLAAAGYDVTLIAQHHANVYANHIRVHAVPKARNQADRMTRTVARVFKAALKLDARLYHFHDPELIPVGILLKLFGKQVIYDVHENVPEDILTKEYIPWNWRKWIARMVGMIEQAGAKCFDGVIGVIPSICQRFPRDKTELIRNFPVAEELATLSGNPHGDRRHHLIYVGRISLERGIREMIQAMGLLPENLDAKLMLAGMFTPRHLCKDVLALDGAKRIDYKGELPRNELKPLFAEARIGLALFHPGPNQSDSYPNKLFEYMSAGIPVVASNFPMWTEIVEQAGCGFLVDPLDVQAIAKAIQWLLEHPDEASEMGARGMKAINSDFNWANEARKLCDFYRRVLGR